MNESSTSMVAMTPVLPREICCHWVGHALPAAVTALDRIFSAAAGHPAEASAVCPEGLAPRVRARISSTTWPRGCLASMGIAPDARRRSCRAGSLRRRYSRVSPMRNATCGGPEAVKVVVGPIHLAKLTYVSYVTYMPDEGDPIARAQALRVAIGRVARRMRQIYATHEAEPTFNEIALLVHLARDGPATPTEIARGERITSQAIAPAIRELQARGLLERSRHPRDGRSTVLTVTDAGRAALADRELDVVARLVRALQDDLTPADRERLESVVPVLNKLADSL